MFSATYSSSGYWWGQSCFTSDGYMGIKNSIPMKNRSSFPCKWCNYCGLTLDANAWGKQTKKANQKKTRKQTQQKKKKACLAFPIKHENDLSIHPFGVSSPKEPGLKHVVCHSWLMWVQASLSQYPQVPQSSRNIFTSAAFYTWEDTLSLVFLGYARYSQRTVVWDKLRLNEASAIKKEQ